MSQYISNLKPLIEDFLEFKNALGIKYVTGSYYLRQLDGYNYENGNFPIPKREVVEGWQANRRKNPSQGTEAGSRQYENSEDT